MMTGAERGCCTMCVTAPSCGEDEELRNTLIQIFFHMIYVQIQLCAKSHTSQFMSVFTLTRMPNAAYCKYPGDTHGMAHEFSEEQKTLLNITKLSDCT